MINHNIMNIILYKKASIEWQEKLFIEWQDRIKNIISKKKID